MIKIFLVAAILSGVSAVASPILNCSLEYWDKSGNQPVAINILPSSKEQIATGVYDITRSDKNISYHVSGGPNGALSVSLTNLKNNQSSHLDMNTESLKSLEFGLTLDVTGLGLVENPSVTSVELSCQDQLAVPNSSKPVQPVLW